MLRGASRIYVVNAGIALAGVTAILPSRPRRRWHARYALRDVGRHVRQVRSPLVYVVERRPSAPVARHERTALSEEQRRRRDRKRGARRARVAVGRVRRAADGSNCSKAVAALPRIRQARLDVAGAVERRVPAEVRVAEHLHVRLQARDAPLEERRPHGLRERGPEPVPFLRDELGPRHEVREGHER